MTIPHQLNQDSGRIEKQAENSRPADSHEALLSVLYSNNPSVVELTFECSQDYSDGFEIRDCCMTLDTACNSLRHLASEFATIDRDGDGVISEMELRDFALHHRGSAAEIEWILCHYKAIAQASHIPHSRIHKADLEHASHVYKGLSFVHQYFNSIATSSGYKLVSAGDLLRTVCCREGLPPAEAEGVWQLIHYLLTLHRERGMTMAAIIDRQKLNDLSPEALWLAPQCKSLRVRHELPPLHRSSCTKRLV